jgi:hypothetical protein
MTAGCTTMAGALLVRRHCPSPSWLSGTVDFENWVELVHEA